MIVVYEKIILFVQSEFDVQRRILMDNHYETIDEQVRIKYPHVRMTS